MPAISSYANKTIPIGTDKLPGTDASDGSTKNFLLSAIRGGAIYPEDYGAVGNGTTDDTTALIAAFAAASGKTMALQPGKTYIYSGSLTLPTNTILFGNGATLKKKAGTASVTTTTSQINANAPDGITVTVTDPAPFAVNMCVSFDDGNPYTTGGVAANFSRDYHRITVINGSTITLATAFQNLTLPSGSYMRMSTGGIIASAGSKIYDLIMDGNKANQLIGASPWGWWAQHYEIYGGQITLVNCEIKNCQSEGVGISGTHNIIRGNYIHDCQGNGLHLSASYKDVIEGNRIYNTNLLNTGGTHLTQNCGHVAGCMCFSDQITNTIIAENVFDTTSYAGIGAIDSTNTDIQILGNVFTACAGNSLTIGADAYRVIVANNKIDSSGLLSIPGVTPLNSDSPAWIIVEGNYFGASGMTATYVNQLSVTGNQFNCPLMASPLTVSSCSADSINEHNLVVHS